MKINTIESSISDFPTSLGNKTLNELINDPKAELSVRAGKKNGKKISLRIYTDEGVMLIEYAEYATNHHKQKEDHVPLQHCNHNYEEEILAMRHQGMLQKDIAFELGISPSYVSQILKKLT